MRKTLFLAAVVALLLSLAGVGSAMAYVWTDQADYTPGSVVTIHGDNSNGAGYLPGETVLVSVAGPNTYAGSCEATPDASGAWSCQVTLPPDESAVGTYTYGARGGTSGAYEVGTFTDANPVHNVNFATSGLPAGSSITINWSKINPAGNPASGTRTFTSPGPSADEGTRPGTTFTYSGFPSSVTVSGVTYNLTGTSPASGFTTGIAGGRTTVTASYTQSNNPPTADAGGPYTVSEGGSVSLAGTGSDPDGDTLTYAWDLDNNGTFETAGQNPTFSAADRDGPGTQSVVLRVCDNHTACATSSTTITIDNVAPTATFNSPTSVNEGSDIDISLTDPVDVPADIPGLRYAFDCGSGYGAFGSSNSASCPTTDNGTLTVKAKIRDKDDGETEYTATVTVNNVAPTVNAGADATIDEGSAFSSSGSFTDPGADTWTATVDYGDGSGVQALALNADKSFPLNHTYADNGSYTVTITVTDDDGGVGSDTATVTVNNVAPTVGAITAPVDPVKVGTLISVSAPFTDPGIQDTHTATWTWGDGDTSAGTVTETNGSGSVSGNHTYTTPGVYTLRLTVIDKDGASGESKLEYVVVYDPAGGFVTGGGWINSPPGAYYPNPSLTGKATFGFVSKYQKGANIPTGNTEFQFHVANMNFKSTSYDWLVIAGAKAQYKGSGTINGAGDYAFMLSAIDGQVNGGGDSDKFRIKIWDKTTGAVVHDNQAGTVDNADPTTGIAGGSIVIHK